MAVMPFLVALVAGCSGPPAVAPSTRTSATTAAIAASSAGASAGASAHTAASASGGCAVFPPDNIWHTDVSALPVHPNSAAYVASIGTTRTVHADFGAGLWEGAAIGIPITTVPAGQAGVRVSFQYASESDGVAYPIPAGVRIEGGPTSDGDRHVILFDPSGCRAYELYAAYPNGDGTWHAGSGAVFDLRSNALRPAGWTSADAAGLPVLAGLVRYEEVAAGRIDHAIRVTAPKTRNGYVWPARHAASSSSDATLPPMGLRLRLKSSVDTSRLPMQARIVAEAMKRYGVILADNGSAWYVSGAPDDRWDNDTLHALGTLTGGDFEAVDTSRLMVTPDSAASRSP